MHATAPYEINGVANSYVQMSRRKCYACNINGMRALRLHGCANEEKGKEKSKSLHVSKDNLNNQLAKLNIIAK